MKKCRLQGALRLRDWRSTHFIRRAAKTQAGADGSEEIRQPVRAKEQEKSREEPHPPRILGCHGTFSVMGPHPFRAPFVTNLIRHGNTSDEDPHPLWDLIRHASRRDTFPKGEDSSPACFPEAAERKDCFSGTTVPAVSAQMSLPLWGRWPGGPDEVCPSGEGGPKGRMRCAPLGKVARRAG